MLRVVLYEVQRGHHNPAAWRRDAAWAEPVRWLLRGCTPSRSCWYAFRDRIAPFLDAFHRHTLHQAVGQGLTTATRGAEAFGDGDGAVAQLPLPADALPRLPVAAGVYAEP